MLSTRNSRTSHTLRGTGVLAATGAKPTPAMVRGDLHKQSIGSVLPTLLQPMRPAQTVDGVHTMDAIFHRYDQRDPCTTGGTYLP